MSCTSPLTVASTIVPLPRVVGLLHVRLEVGDRGLHHLGRLQHERQLHLAGAEQLADDLHPGEQVVVDDVQRRLPVSQRLVEVGLQAVALAVDDPPLEPLGQRQRGQLLGPGRPWCRGVVDALEQLEQPLQRVVALATAGRRPGRARPRAARRGSATSAGSCGVHDRGVEPGLDALVQEHRVEHHARGRVEPERDVGDAERGLHLGVAPLDLADRLDRLERRRGGSPPARWRSGRSGSRRGCRSIRIPHSPVRSSMSRDGDLRPSTRRCGPGPPRRWSGRPRRRRAP